MKISIANSILFVCGILLTTLQTTAHAGQSNTGVRAQQLPLSGGLGGSSVSMRQNATGQSGTNTIGTTLQVEGHYQGSMPDPTATGTSIHLTLRDAIRRGLQFNLAAVSAGASLRYARAERISALSEMLPKINASLGMNEEIVDLQAEGLSSSTLKRVSPTLASVLPVTVGPFHYYDARVSVGEDAFDLVALHNHRSQMELQRAAELNEHDVRDLVILAVNGGYLNVLAAQALVASQTAQVQYAQSSFDQAAAQHAAGTKALIDAERSQVQLMTEQQRLRSNQADLEKQKLSLARMLGLPLGTQLILAETLTPNPQPLDPVNAMIARGIERRADLQSAEASVRAAEQALKAARAERLPNVGMSGFYGIQGIAPSNGGNGVFSVSGSVNIPLWQGRRTEADVRAAQAVADQRRAEFADKRSAVEMEIRSTYIDATVANDQVSVADKNRKLALDTLRQSQDRFVAGVATSVEVVQSEESLAAAERDYINSLYSQNLALISLWRATGDVEQHISSLLKEHQDAN
jgi:outer membrane protein TolC